MKAQAAYTRIQVAVFLCVVLLILYVVNVVVYQAFVGLFTVTFSSHQWAVGGVLGVFSGSFVLASVVGMRFYNLLTRTFYYVSAVWMGFLVYFFLASVLFGVLLLLQVPVAVQLGQWLFLGAFMVSAYGVYNAHNIVVSTCEVKISNLPQPWKGRKAVWISDLHLGQIYGPEFASRVVQKVNALPHDVIFIGGDLYDGTGAPDIVELAAPLSKFLAPLGTFFVTGNHEEIGDSGAFVRAVQAAGIRTLIDQKVEIEGLQIIGVDYRSGSNREIFQGVLKALDVKATNASVLLKHEPRDLDIARDAGISLQLSGHTHRAQLWPLGYIAHLVYKGYSYGLKTIGGMQIYTSSGTGTWGPPMRVGTHCEIVHITFG